MELQNFMTTDVTTVTPDDYVIDAAKKMYDYNIGSVPVCNETGRIMGIVTDRDIVLRDVAMGKDPNQTKVDEVMTRDVIYGSPEMEAREAANLMARKQIRRLPVVKNDKLVGIVALGDLATEMKMHQEAGDALTDISSPSMPKKNR